MVVTVYVLRSVATGKRYVGITANFHQRMEEHRTAKSTVAKLLGEFQAVYTEAQPNYVAARAREKYLKSGQGREWLDQHLLGQS